jgi:hypothetical protein
VILHHNINIQTALNYDAHTPTRTHTHTHTHTHTSALTSTPNLNAAVNCTPYPALSFTPTPALPPGDLSDQLARPDLGLTHTELASYTAHWAAMYGVNPNPTSDPNLNPNPDPKLRRTLGCNVRRLLKNGRGFSSPVALECMPGAAA